MKKYYSDLDRLHHAYPPSYDRDVPGLVDDLEEESMTTDELAAIREKYQRSSMSAEEAIFVASFDVPALLAHIASLEGERDLLQDQLATQDSALADAAIIEERRDAECEALAVQMTSLEARVATLVPVVAKAQEAFTESSYMRQMPLLQELSAMARALPDERGKR